MQNLHLTWYKKSCGTYIQAPPDSYVLKLESKWSRNKRKSIAIYEHLCSDIFTWSSNSQEIKIKDNETPQEVIQKKNLLWFKLMVTNQQKQQRHFYNLTTLLLTPWKVKIRRPIKYIRRPIKYIKIFVLLKFWSWIIFNYQVSKYFKEASNYFVILVYFKHL